jgi:hypothetical protein
MRFRNMFLIYQFFIYHARKVKRRIALMCSVGRGALVPDDDAGMLKAVVVKRIRKAGHENNRIRSLGKDTS